jgi:hypothetical protein
MATPQEKRAILMSAGDGMFEACFMADSKKKGQYVRNMMAKLHVPYQSSHASDEADVAARTSTRVESDTQKDLVTCYDLNLANEVWTEAKANGKTDEEADREANSKCYRRIPLQRLFWLVVNGRTYDFRKNVYDGDLEQGLTLDNVNNDQTHQTPQNPDGDRPPISYR